MRAARAEIGGTLGDFDRLGEPALSGGDLFQPSPERRILSVLQQARAERDCDVVGIERAMDREEPLALLVLLADHHGLVRSAVELLAQLDLDQRALLLDDHDEVEPSGEVLQLLRIERPGAGDLEQADAEIIGADLVEAEFLQRLAHVEIGFADGDDADARRLPTGEDGLVELVGAQVGEDRGALVQVQALFLVEEIELAADAEAARRHDEIIGDRDADPVDRAVDRGGRFDVVLDAFQADPDAGEARERKAV